MKNILLKLSFTLLLSAITISSRAQLKQNDGSSLEENPIDSTLIAGEIETEETTPQFDTVPRSFPDSLVQPKIVPSDYNPGIFRDSVSIFDLKCDDALEANCVRKISRTDYYCTSASGSRFLVRRLHSILVQCYRTINENGKRKCEMSTWSFFRWEHFGTCYAEYKMGSFESEQETNTATSGILSVFPNPIKEEATLNIHLKSNTDKISIKIIDLNGKIVDELYQESLPEGDVSVSTSFAHLANGLYSAALYLNGTYSGSIKMVISH